MTEFEPSAPPSEPFEVRPVKLKSSWPMLLGVASIVLGVLGLLNAIATVMVPLFIAWFEKMTPATDVNVMGVMKEWETWMVVMGVVSMALAALLLIAGIGLVLRRRWGVRLHLSWAAMKLVWGPVVVVVGTMMQMEQNRAMQTQMASQGGPSMGAFMDQMMIVSAVIGMLWAVALPIASLIWLLSPRARREVKEWDAAPVRRIPAPS